MTEQKTHTLYTIGHSNNTIEDFILMLEAHGVTCVADVRSAPYSRYCPQFNRDPLARALRTARIDYKFLGDRLGARPNNPNCYDGDHVNLEQVAQTEEFKSGLKHLIDAASHHRIALMCAEKEPLECHRCILICRRLKGCNLDIKHILADGAVEDHAETERRLVKMMKIEPTLFEPQKTEADFIQQAYDKQAQKISHAPDSQASATTQDTLKN